MTTQELYARFNKGLLDLRESFHRTGRLDDSNTKLDEIVKLLSIEIAQVHGFPKGALPLKDVLHQYRAGKIQSIVRYLNDILPEVAKTPLFLNPDGESLLGNNPQLSIPESEEQIAEQVVELVVTTFNGCLRNPQASRNFELLNEAFGHFVRDNFRNNIEDAQYMTPPEVVTYMCGLAVEELKAGRLGTNDELIVADPSCGVGSFLAQFYRHITSDPGITGIRPKLVGQDKVDRMARLARLNLLLFNTTDAVVSRGNSLIGESPMDAYSGRCDLILTNPPFGARFPTGELAKRSMDRYPLLHDLIRGSSGTIDSELLFLDRYYALLKPGGVLLAVLPDATISAAGLPQAVRDRIGRHFIIRSVTELPSVTFGQAGTRTKTCVLHLQKVPASQRQIFVATAKSLGFEVASRKGVPVKKPVGRNDLEIIEAQFKEFVRLNENVRTAILCEEPSAVATTIEKLNEEGWTPNHHSATRYQTLVALSTARSDSDFSSVKLRDLVTTTGRSQRDEQLAWDNLVQEHAGNKLRIGETDNAWKVPKCISVLHVGDFGFLNIRELMHYRPKYPGQPCQPGEVLFSKINPRIPRVLVVPEFPVPLTCSTEFEVLRPKSDVSPFKLALLILSSFAQNQILSLTSGTSSSHNRIKSAQLLDIRLPMPKSGTKYDEELSLLAQRFRDAQTALHQSAYDSFNYLVSSDKLLATMVH